MEVAIKSLKEDVPTRSTIVANTPDELAGVVSMMSEFDVEYKKLKELLVKKEEYIKILQYTIDKQEALVNGA